MRPTPMPNDPLIEATSLALERAWINDGVITWDELAQAALAAIRESGFVVIPWGVISEAASAFAELGWRDSCERAKKLRDGDPPAAALVVVPQYRTEMGAAAERYLYKVCRHAHPLPQQFKWEDCFNEMLAVALVGRKDEPT